MKKLGELLKSKESRIGYLYFYVHFVVEVTCFFTLSRIIGNSFLLWIIPFFYDMFAFVPQALIGYISDKYEKLAIGFIGWVLLITGFLAFFLTHISIYLSIFLICIGNACLHIDGAETTLRCSKGKLSPSAIFVSGGSFGVICGKLLGKSAISFYLLLLLLFSLVPCLLLGRIYKNENGEKGCYNYNFHNPNKKIGFILLLSVSVVAIRGYMGYGIPTSWNKTIFETICLYSFMGLGKALGGISIDIIGIRKTAITSVVLGLPFLLFGNHIMMISLIGVMLFSMTMAVTLALLVSILKEHPGLAFGYTTIGLFLGTLPIFFIRFKNLWANNIIIILLSFLSLLLLLKITKKEEKNV